MEEREGWREQWLLGVWGFGGECFSRAHGERTVRNISSRGPYYRPLEGCPRSSPPSPSVLFLQCQARGGEGTRGR